TDRSAEGIVEKVLNNSGEGTSKQVKRSKVKKVKKVKRNYNLGSLVTFKWIAAQYANEITADPFISYRKMKDDIRQKFMIDVSLGQCRRAKQRALFDHEV
ncbi:hypothetical protein Tco_0633038, partial [Tanacetum coccineum]